MKNQYNRISLNGGDDPLFREQIRALRAKLEYRFSTLGLNTIAITSAVAGEGKTLLSLALAMEFSSNGNKKVLLVDLDLRKSDLKRTFNTWSSNLGITDFLQGSASLDEIVHHDSEFPGFHVVFTGRLRGEPANLLGGERMVDFLMDVRKKFDMVILDTPPVVPVADTIVLKRFLKTFLFVYLAGSTPHPILKQAIEDIGEENILGVVLNSVKRERARYYNRYYGKYYEPKSQ